MTSIVMAKEGSRIFDKALFGQFTRRQKKEEEGLEKLYSKASEAHLVALYLLDQYHNPRR